MFTRAIEIVIEAKEGSRCRDGRGPMKIRAIANTKLPKTDTIDG